MADDGVRIASAPRLEWCMTSIDRIGGLALGTVALRAEQQDHRLRCPGRLADGRRTAHRHGGGLRPRRERVGHRRLAPVARYPGRRRAADQGRPPRRARLVEPDVPGGRSRATSARASSGSASSRSTSTSSIVTTPSIPVGEILDPLAAAVVDRVGPARSASRTGRVARLDEADTYAASRGWPPIAWCSNSLSLARSAGAPWPGVVDATDDASRAWFASHPARG